MAVTLNPGAPHVAINGNVEAYGLAGTYGGLIYGGGGVLQLGSGSLAGTITVSPTQVIDFILN